MFNNIYSLFLINIIRNHLKHEIYFKLDQQNYSHHQYIVYFFMLDNILFI